MYELLWNGLRAISNSYNPDFHNVQIVAAAQVSRWCGGLCQVPTVGMELQWGGWKDY